MAKPSVHLLYEHDTSGRPHSSAYIRLIQPFQEFSLSRHFSISASLELPKSNVDVVVVDRLWKGWGSERDVEVLLDSVRRRNIILIHAVDDNLYDLCKEPANWNYASHIVSLLTASADHVVVTTSELKRRALSVNRSVSVVRNVLDADLFNGSISKSATKRGSVVAGYMGSFTHAQDLGMVYPALRRLEKNGVDITLQVVGGGDPSELMDLYGGLVRYIHPPIGYDYPEFISWMAFHSDWDFAIAPLKDSHFNRFKSDIKWLDYSMLGVAGIYSKVPAYESTIKNSINGLLVDNRMEDWVDALQKLSEDANLRGSIVTNSRREINASRLTKHAACDWLAVIKKFI